MTTKIPNNPEDLSPFLQAALELDQHLTQLERVTNNFLKADIKTDKGMKRSLSQLDQFNEVRDRIGKGMARLGQTLEETRQRIEASTNSVSDRATAIQERQQLVQVLIQRFRLLGEKVAEVTSQASEVGKEMAGTSTNSGGFPVVPQLIGKLDELVSTASQLKDDAHRANLKMVEQSADMLRQKIHATSKRLAELRPPAIN